MCRIGKVVEGFSVVRFSLDRIRGSHAGLLDVETAKFFGNIRVFAHELPGKQQTFLNALHRFTICGQRGAVFELKAGLTFNDVCQTMLQDVHGE